MRKWVVLAAIWPGVALAQDWVRLSDDAAVLKALAGRSVQYDPLTQQRFGALGDTTYVTERAADGRWTARGGQYCSVWPPSDQWACYDLYVDGEHVRFVGADRSVSDGVFIE